MTVRRLSCWTLLLLASIPLYAADAPLPRHPAPSPDGSRIAFSWQGDLWLVPAVGGAARRLTAHPASDRFPIWSRDGRLIAFASDRHGSSDVFVMATDGSEATRRLTFASVKDRPVDFTPDGSQVLFSSRRGEGIRWMPELYTVPMTGGTPALAQTAFGDTAAYSPDGEALVFIRGATRWTRRGYRGAANRELWLRTSDGEYVQLTRFDGDDDAPSWADGHSLVFLSARSGRKNLFRLDLITDAVEQLTFHDGSDIRSPRGAADGSIVAYEFEDAIWTVTTGGGEPTRIEIDVPQDLVVNPVERYEKSQGATDLAVNPEAKIAAFLLHGDIFVTDITSEEDQEIAPPPTARVTTSPEREQDVSWSPDGERLLFATARDGNLELYTARPADDTPWAESFDFELTRLTDAPESDHSPRYSADGERIAFIRGKGTLMVMSADGSEQRTLLDHWQTPDWQWSPDGQWIAYSIPDMHYNTEVWIVSADGGEPYNVSRHPDDDVSPRWSPDGKRLVWSSARHGESVDVWGVWLTRADDERTPAQWLKLWQEEEDESDNGDDSDTAGEDEEEASALPIVTIEFDRLWERASAISDLLGDEGPALVSGDGKRVVFTADSADERDLYSVRWDGDDLERLTTGDQQPSSVQFDGAGETLYYLGDGGTIKRVDLDGEAGDPVPFEARYEVDREVERGVVFDETWRALDEWFYDPEFHGVDWPAQHDKYRPWAVAAAHDDDFADVLNLMLGELNASHMGYYPAGNGDGEATGFIGAFFDPTASGPGLLVREVLPDSPAAHAEVGLQAGERIVTVNRKPVSTGTNIYALFADTVGHRVPLKIVGVDGTERPAIVIPVTSRAQRQLRYEEWVRQRRRLAEELSDGRLGYIHVQGMDIPSFEEFERGLHAAAAGKDGLIVDVRSNGGGWTTDYLMAVLMVQRHAYTVPRDSDPTIRGYPQGRLPLAAWTRPAVALCNEDSYSNAEIFSHAFKTLERGLLVGTPTFGAVISTGGTTVLNGARVRQPLRGWYVAGSGLNMELNGAVPDVLVPTTPDEDSAHDRDSQLERAVEILLEGLDADPRAGAW